MTYTTTMLIIWIVCAPLSYILMRRFHVAEFRRWTQIDRASGLFMSIFGGPMMLMCITLVFFLVWLCNKPWAGKEAKW